MGGGSMVKKRRGPCFCGACIEVEEANPKKNNFT